MTWLSKKTVFDKSLPENGDPVFWVYVPSLLVHHLPVSGNIVGPLLFFSMMDVIRMAFLWYTQEFGCVGSEIILKDITKGAYPWYVRPAVLVQRWVSISNFTINLPGKQLSEGAYINFS